MRGGPSRTGGGGDRTSKNAIPQGQRERGREKNGRRHFGGSRAGKDNCKKKGRSAILGSTKGKTKTNRQEAASGLGGEWPTGKRTTAKRNCSIGPAGTQRGGDRQLRDSQKRRTGRGKSNEVGRRFGTDVCPWRAREGRRGKKKEGPLVAKSPKRG